MSVCIAGTGHYLPGPPVGNAELMDRYGLWAPERFVSRSVGAVTRHLAAPEQATSDLAVEAARAAIESSGLQQSEIRRVLLATVSGDHPTPATAALVQHRLGLVRCAAIDVVGACAGFVQALDLGWRGVATGAGPTLVIGADVRSRQVNWSDPRTAFLYGDGAGAVVLTPCGPDRGFAYSALVGDGAGHGAVRIPAGGSREPITTLALQARRDRITMPNGRVVARAALAGIVDLVSDMTAATSTTVDEIALACVHQPNLPLVHEMLASVGIPVSRSWINFDRCGNTSSATVPIALAEAVRAGRIADGEWLCLAAVGAGYAGGIHLIRWGTA